MNNSSNTSDPSGPSSGAGLPPETIDAVLDETRKIVNLLFVYRRSNRPLWPAVILHELRTRILGAGLIDPEHDVHFRALAAGVLRRVLVEHAGSIPTAGYGTPVRLIDEQGITGGGSVGLMRLQETLDELQPRNPAAVRMIDLRFFGGLDPAQIARVLRQDPRKTRADFENAVSLLRAGLSRA